MMMRISAIYDQQVTTASQRLLSMIEPLLIVGLGVLIAGIIMAILAGIISINGLPL